MAPNDDRRVSRALVWRRASSRCEYCQVPESLDPSPFQLDHVIPRKHRGPDTEDNLALSCFGCNVHKGPNLSGVDPETGEIASLYDPRRDRWADHFEWQGAVLLGRTRTGRLTVDVLGINLSHRVAFRQALVQEGVFPPRS